MQAGMFAGIEVDFRRDYSRQVVEQHLDNVVAEKDCGRSELVRDAQLPDLFLAEIPEGWVRQGCIFEADVIAKDNGKTNKDGKHMFHGSFRDAKHLARDPRTAVALHLHHLLIHEGFQSKLIEDFKPRREYGSEFEEFVWKRPWMDWYLMLGFGKSHGHARDVYSSSSGKTQR